MSVFSPDEADGIALLIQSAQPTGEVTYQTIALPKVVKDDTILLAYEERLLLPRQSSPGGAWQDRVLAFAPGTVFIMPKMVRALMGSAADAGIMDPIAAVRQVLAEAAPSESDRLSQLLMALAPHATARRMETGLDGHHQPQNNARSRPSWRYRSICPYWNHEPLPQLIHSLRVGLV
jgi:hypothetical protein